jgi:hypothetical protein
MMGILVDLNIRSPPSRGFKREFLEALPHAIAV